MNNFRHSFPLYPCLFLDTPQKPSIAFAKKRNSQPKSEPILERSIIEDVAMNEDEDTEDDPFLEDGKFFLEESLYVNAFYFYVYLTNSYDFVYIDCSVICIVSHMKYF